MLPEKATNTDHPDLIGGIVWSSLELKWIRDRDERWSEEVARLTSERSDLIHEVEILIMQRDELITTLEEISKTHYFDVAVKALNKIKGK